MFINKIEINALRVDFLIYSKIDILYQQIRIKLFHFYISMKMRCFANRMYNNYHIWRTVLQIDFIIYFIPHTLLLLTIIWLSHLKYIFHKFQVIYSIDFIVFIIYYSSICFVWIRNPQTALELCNSIIKRHKHILWYQYVCFSKHFCFNSI